jgi:two-component system response regulator AtoC
MYTEARRIRQEGKGCMATPAPVLIVDGNPSMTVMLQRFLTRQQVDAQAVLSPAEAHAALAQQAFRVVLTDYFAPSGDGLALLRYIREAVPATQGILMAAFGAPEIRHAALAAGAYAWIAKPFRLQALWDIVQPALQGFPAPEASRRYGQGGPGQQPGG